MEMIFENVAGLDVHQKTIVACVRTIQPQGGHIAEEVLTFGTMTRDLLQLSDWLAKKGVTHVAMESTGVLWRPVWNILDGGQFELLLVNPRELKRVPGRKSDVSDSQWIAQLLQCGLFGTDMTRFPDEEHLSSWAGMCPGNEESAGKRIRRRTTKGDSWLRVALTEAAWAAGHSKHSYLEAQYRRIAARRGKKRALTAVGHTLLVIFYHMLKTGVSYKDLGPDFFDKLKPEQYRRYLVKRLESLGFNVELKPKDAAA